MCTDATVNKHPIHTQGELVKALGIALSDLVYLDGYTNDAGVNVAKDAAGCLCPVDGRGTAKANGLRFVQHGWTEKHGGEMEFFRRDGDPSHG